MLFQRVLTAAVLAPLMLAGIFFLPLTGFMVFAGLITLLGAWEWSKLAAYSRFRAAYIALLLLGIGVIAKFDLLAPVVWLGGLWWLLAWYLVKRFPGRQGLWSSRPARAVMGPLVLLPMWSGLVMLKQQDQSALLLSILMLYVWGADIGAYFVGRAFGDRKLAPTVSPGKTWAGALGGLLTGSLISVATGFWMTHQLTVQWQAIDWLVWLLLAVMVVILSVIGDLLESMVKRHRGLKDSGQILPGHGGVMDRIDSLCAATPVYVLGLLLWPALIGGIV